jgi:hypothetical protein
MTRSSSAGPKGPSPLHIAEADRLLLAYTAAPHDAASIADAIEKVCRGLTGYLAPLITRHAALALLTRAVFLSKRRFKILNAVSTREADAEVARELPACLRSAAAKDALEAASDVLANFVWLLTRFVNEELGLRLLREACPNADEDDL